MRWGLQLDDPGGFRSPAGGGHGDGALRSHGAPPLRAEARLRAHPEDPRPRTPCWSVETCGRRVDVWRPRARWTGGDDGPMTSRNGRVVSGDGGGRCTLGEVGERFWDKKVGVVRQGLFSGFFQM